MRDNPNGSILPRIGDQESWLKIKNGPSKGARPDANEISEAEIDQNLMGTFPASDPPSWTLGVERLGKPARVRSVPSTSARTSLMDFIETLLRLLSLPGQCLSKLSMIRTDPIASPHEDNSDCDGYDTDHLHNAHQDFVSSYAVDKKKSAGDEPD